MEGGLDLSNGSSRDQESISDEPSCENTLWSDYQIHLVKHMKVKHKTLMIQIVIQKILSAMMLLVTSIWNAY